MVTRGVPTDLIEDMRGHFCPVMLTYADWPDEEIRIHTGFGNLSWGGHTWTGTGTLVQFQAPYESGGLATSQATIHVAATIEDMMAIRGIAIRNRDFMTHFATTTTPGGNVLKTTPLQQFFSGYFDSRTGSLTRSGGDLAHDMVLGIGVGPSARASASITHNYEDQIAGYPGDTAGRHVQTANRLRFNPQTWPE